MDDGRTVEWVGKSSWECHHAPNDQLTNQSTEIQIGAEVLWSLSSVVSRPTTRKSCRRSRIKSDRTMVDVIVATVRSVNHVVMVTTVQEHIHVRLDVMVEIAFHPFKLAIVTAHRIA